MTSPFRTNFVRTSAIYAGEIFYFRAAQLLIVSALLLIGVSPALAAGGGMMPWDSFMEQVFDSITGPWLRVAGGTALIVCFIGFAYSAHEGILKGCMKVGMMVCGAFNVVSWALPALGFSGGALV